MYIPEECPKCIKPMVASGDDGQNRLCMCCGLEFQLIIVQTQSARCHHDGWPAIERSCDDE
jgi:hypothetical protein